MASGRRPGRGPQRLRLTPRGRLAFAGAALVALVVVVGLSSGGGSLPPLPAPGIASVPRSGDPFAYFSGRDAAFSARATAGQAHVLFAKSPGGVMATAARVASFRGLVDAAVSGTGIDPALVEGIVFLESAGYPNAIAGTDPTAASGLTQIVAETGQSLLGMHVDLARSRFLTAAIFRAGAAGRRALVARLEAQRARVDDRFNPRLALAATVRYLRIALGRFGRIDLAVESYHMGIGNLGSVLSAYDGGRPVPYVRLYFDTFPDRHGAAYALLSSFGDDSWTYWWRVLGAVQIMQLYRGDRTALARLAGLQTASDSAAEVLHPPDVSGAFADPDAVDRAYAGGSLVPLPRNAAALGLAYDPGIGSQAAALHAGRALYRGLRPEALALLLELAGRVRALSGGAPLVLTSAVEDSAYQRSLGISDPPAAAGWSFTIARRYVSHSQAAAFQAMLDRLQALNLIAWTRYPSEIEVTVASDARRVIQRGV